MVKIGYPHAREFAVTGAREQCATYDPAQRLGAGIYESAALVTVEMADAGGIGLTKGYNPAPCLIRGRFPLAPGMVEGGFEDCQDAVGSGAAPARRFRVIRGVTDVLLLSRPRAKPRGRCGDFREPFAKPCSGQRQHFLVAQTRQDKGVDARLSL